MAKRPLNCSLDRMREDLAALDEAIETARSLTKPRKGTLARDTLQGLKKPYPYPDRFRSKYGELKRYYRKLDVAIADWEWSNKSYRRRFKNKKRLSSEDVQFGKRLAFSNQHRRDYRGSSHRS